MVRARILIAVCGLVALGVVASVQPAAAATGVTINVIEDRTVTAGGTVTVSPSVTVHPGSTLIVEGVAVYHGSDVVAPSGESATVGAGTYMLLTGVLYVEDVDGVPVWKYAQRVQVFSVTEVASGAGPEPEPSQGEEPAEPDCGVTRYKHDGTTWECVLSDDFGGSKLDTSIWTPQRTSFKGMHVGPECLVDDPDNLSVSGGVLRVTTRVEADEFTCKSPNGDYTTRYTSGGVTTYGKYAQTYGRFEFRAKFPDVQVPGLQTSLWMFPTSMSYGAWPASGEIDVAEFYSAYPDRSIPYLHYLGLDIPDPGLNGVTNWFCKLDPSRFNTYAAEWTDTTITILHNDEVCLTHTISSPLGSSGPFDKPFTMIITQVLGAGTTNLFDPGTMTFPATTEVDWVRAWK